MEGTAVERTSGIAGEQSLAERVNAYILTQHSSIHAVAKEVGYSRTSVSRYLSGKYDSCAASLEEKLAEFLEAHTGEARSGAASRRGFMRAGTQRRCWGYARAARSTSGLGSWWGGPGTGRPTR